MSIITVRSIITAAVVVRQSKLTSHIFFITEFINDGTRVYRGWYLIKVHRE